MSKFKLEEKKAPLQSNVGLIQTFSYSKGTTGLNFQLKLDDGGKELRDFKECLIKAVEDVTKVLEE